MDKLHLQQWIEEIYLGIDEIEHIDRHSDNDRKRLEYLRAMRNAIVEYLKIN